MRAEQPLLARAMLAAATRHPTPPNKRIVNVAAALAIVPVCFIYIKGTKARVTCATRSL